MTKSHFAAVAIVAVTMPMIALQYSQNSKLKTEAETLRLALTSARAPENPSAPQSPPGADKGKAAKTRSVNRQPGESGIAGSASLREILAQSDPMHRIDALLDYVNRLAPDEIPGALRELRESSPDWDPEAKILTHMLLTRWAREDPDAAFASLNTLDFKKSGGDATSILASLASLDPARAAAWLNDPDNALVHYPKMGDILAGTVAKEWVRQDAEAALEWARSLPEGQRAGAYTGVLETLAASDPKRASGLAMQLEPGKDRSRVIGEIAATWARRSPEEALAWARSLSGGDGKRALSETLQSWANLQPADAVAYLEALSASESIDAHLPEVAGSWSTRAPGEAASWVASQPEGEGKNNAMGAVMWNWTSQDPEAASTWLSEQPPGASRDRGITGLSKAAFDSDPAAAVTWAAQINDEKLRSGAVDAGLRVWVDRDPEAARDWAGGNGITLPESRVKGGSGK